MKTKPPFVITPTSTTTDRINSSLDRSIANMKKFNKLILVFGAFSIGIMIYSFVSMIISINSIGTSVSTGTDKLIAVTTHRDEALDKILDDLHKETEKTRKLREERQRDHDKFLKELREIIKNR